MKSSYWFSTLFPAFVLWSGGLMLSGCKLFPSAAQRAEKAYELYRFTEAAQLYGKLYSKTRRKEKKADYAFRAAEAYRKANRYREAVSWYKKALRFEYPDPKVAYYLARMQAAIGDYDEAMATLDEYLKNNPNDESAREWKNQLDKLKDWNPEEDSRFVVTNFRKANSSSNDFAPALFKGGMIFASDREEATGKKTYEWTGNRHSDLFFIKRIRIGRGRKVSYKWGEVSRIPHPINTPFNEGTVAFGPKDAFMLYTQCNGPEGKAANCRIMISRLRGSRWSEPKVLPLCKDSTVNYGHPSLSADGRKLFFSSDMPGGYGGKDIWVSFYSRKAKTWGDPVNLGPIVNTPGDEMFPFIYKDTILYFASNSHNSMGGLDIYMTHGQGTRWSPPKNLMPPVNTTSDDFGIIFDKSGEKGFFSSNRPNGKGQDDIYEFYLKPLIFTLDGHVYDVETKEPIDSATVVLTIYPDTTQKEIRLSDSSGYYFYKLQPETKYTVEAQKAGYYSSSLEVVSTIGLEKSQHFVRDLYLKMIKLTAITIEGIFYGLDSFNLRPESIPVLDSLVDVLKRNPYLVIEIGSHTDCRASYEYNIELSQKRAQSVVDYLVAKGIDPERLVAKGYGETQLVNNCACENGRGPGLRCTEEEHQANRRTTFRVLRTDYKPKPKPKANTQKATEQPDELTPAEELDINVDELFEEGPQPTPSDTTVTPTVPMPGKPVKPLKPGRSEDRKKEQNKQDNQVNKLLKRVKVGKIKNPFKKGDE